MLEANGESLERAGAAPRRPALEVAVALALGSALGPQLPAAARLALALGAGVALGLCLRRGGARRAPSFALLALIALAQALRAEALAAGAPPPPHEGRLEIVRAGEGAVLARLGGARGALLELPPGAAREGERVRLLGAAGPARGVRGPSASGPPAARAVHADELVRLAPARGLERWRSALHARCARFGSQVSRGLAAALLLGERDGLDAAQTDLYARVGLSHLLAVSGMHVGLVAALVLAPLGARLARRSRRGELERALWIAGGLLVYAVLVGGDAPVRRAALGGALACLAPLIGRARGGRRVDGLSLWGAALALELALDARALDDLGLQLSYAAVLALILGTRALARALGGSDARDDAQAGARRGWLRLPGLVAARARRATRLALAASLAASVGTLPLSTAHFGEWSPIGVLVTPPAVALTGALLAFGWPALLLPGAPGSGVFDLAAQWLQGLALAADALPGTPQPFPARPLALGLSVAAAGLASLRPGVPAAWGRAARAGAALWLLPWSAAPAALEVVALDVGHGTAVLLRAPGLGTWVFDAGSRDRSSVGRAGLGPELAAWDASPERVILSHLDRDHHSGLDWLVERHPPRVWWGALPAPLGERLAHAASRLDLDQGSLSEAQAGRFEAALLRGSAAGDNEGSRSLALTWEGRRIVLCGDAEGQGLAELLASWRPPEPLDLLLVPHHGSHSPWLGELLEAWRPREVWVSSAELPPVAAELERRGLRWRCTARDGPLRALLPARP